MNHRSRLLAGHAPDRNDDRIRYALQVMPAPNRFLSLGKVGIANGQGVVYREILTFGALDLLHLTAKLNSLGYCIDQPRGDLRARRYVRVFKAA